MKTLIVLLALLVSGCASTSTSDTMSIKKYYFGYKQYDPCIRCGEKFQQLPNWQHEAIIRSQRGEQW